MSTPSNNEQSPWTQPESGPSNANQAPSGNYGAGGAQFQGGGNYQPGGYYPGQQYANPGLPPVGAKSRLVAGLLGIFLGALGIHNFYLGRNSIGLAQLLISVLSIGLLSVVSGLWGFVEGILYLASRSPRWSTDADGNLLQG